MGSVQIAHGVRAPVAITKDSEPHHPTPSRRVARAGCPRLASRGGELRALPWPSHALAPAPATASSSWHAPLPATRARPALRARPAGSLAARHHVCPLECEAPRQSRLRIGPPRCVDMCCKVLSDGSAHRMSEVIILQVSGHRESLEVPRGPARVDSCAMGLRTRSFPVGGLALHDHEHPCVF